MAAEQGRGLRFALDYITPRARLGDHCDDCEAEHITTACRSGHVLNGQMDLTRVETAWRWRAHAVHRQYCAS